MNWDDKEEKRQKFELATTLSRVNLVAVTWGYFNMST